MVPNIYLIGCGGTIAGRASSETQLVGYKAGEIGVAELIRAVPEIASLAHVTGEQFCNMDSSSMTQQQLMDLSRRVQQLVDQGNVDGIVITHGTDSMDETAYFLNLTVHTHKPIVIVGSMRPATAISADGPLNLLEAVCLAATPEAGEYGVLQCMNGTICAARYVLKGDTSHVHAFSDGQLGCLGFMHDGKPVFYQKPLRKHTYGSEWTLPTENSLPEVWILYCHIGMSTELITAARKAGVKGLVLVGMGHGSLPKYILPELQQAEQEGMVVVRATRALGGIISPVAMWEGTVAADNLSPQKARILLQLALTKTQDLTQIQKYFDEY